MSDLYDSEFRYQDWTTIKGILPEVMRGFQENEQLRPGWLAEMKHAYQYLLNLPNFDFASYFDGALETSLPEPSRDFLIFLWEQLFPSEPWKTMFSPEVEVVWNGSRNLPKDKELVSRLTGEFGYPSSGAQLLVQEIGKLDLQLHDAFNLWWCTGQIPTVEIDGYTVQKLMIEKQMNPIAAILTLDGLLKSPSAMKASLQRGYDRVTVRRLPALPPRS